MEAESNVTDMGSNFWERSEFRSFGALPECQCWYDFEFWINHEEGSIILPPSPNWFFINAVDSRADDSLLVSATYKSVLVQRLQEGKNLPKTLKVIPNKGDKTQGVALCPWASEPEYGHTAACVCEGATVRLFNLHTGDIVASHTHHEGVAVNGVCWGRVDEAAVVVTVGGGGRVVAWQPLDDVCLAHTLHQAPELTAVEANPADRTQALVAASRDIALVNLKSGKVLAWFKGHDQPVYCLRWYEGEESPLADECPTNSRAEALKEGSGRGFEDRNKTPSKGPFFASSDYGRNIHLWDVSAKRYISKTNVPVSAAGYKRHTASKDKGKAKHHIPIAWHHKHLLSSTVQGELLQWTCNAGTWKYTLVHHHHHRPVYTLAVVGSVVVSSGQDRLLHGHCLASLTHLFQLPTLGGCSTTLAFCPQDAARLAVGSSDTTIRFIKFGSPTPLQSHTAAHNIKGKILSLSWHPEQDGQLLFGTAMGQVGWVRASGNQVTTFAYYHQKATYKVEWAPPVCPNTSGVREGWCAYSFGDREIVMRTPQDPLADPISLKNLVPDSDKKKFPKDITEFSFSPDYDFLAVGLNDGQVLLYRRQDLSVAATVVVVRKAVQHLLWKPESGDGRTFTLAVASTENNIYLFTLGSVLKGSEDKNPEESTLVTQASRVLSGHESRAVWLAWSPHKPSVLASASYDHTVQLWDTDNGSMLGNYGGHTARVFRVEFSPTDPDLLFSCAEENSLHSWRPSLLTCKTPADSNAVLKAYRAKKEPPAAAAAAAAAAVNGEEATPPQDPRDKTLASAEDETTAAATAAAGPKAPSVGDGTTKKSSSSSSDGGKKTPHKSFFPRLHSVCSRKRGFHHLLLLSMLALREARPQQAAAPAGKEDSQDLDDLDDLQDEVGQAQEEAEEEIDARPIVATTTDKYSFLLEKDSEMAPPEDFLYALQQHGDAGQMDALLTSEMEVLEARGGAGQASLMHCWRGSLASHIRQAARQRRLTPFLVASAPQVSIKLWETASQAYAEQLLAEGDAVTAASYLLNLHQVEEAVAVLLQRRHFREALAVVKSRLGDSPDQLAKVVGHWVNTAIHEGNVDLAASLQLGTGQLEAAARTLSRRADPSSLFVAAKVYAAAGNTELATSTGLVALREASARQETDKVEAYLCHLPGLEWFRLVSTLHRLLLKVVQQQQQQEDNASSYNYYLPAAADSVEATAAETAGGRTCLVEEVKRCWHTQGFSPDQHPDLYQLAVTHLSTQQSPSSVKQLWFLVAVSLTECLLAPTRHLWDQHLTQALQHALTWGKPDQLLHLTHTLLPGGKTDLAALRQTVPQQPVEGEAVPPPCLQVLWQCYQQAEVALLHSFLTSGRADPLLLPPGELNPDAKREAPGQAEAQTSEAAALASEGGEAAEAGQTQVGATHKDEAAAFSLPQSISSLKSTLSWHVQNIDPDPTVILDQPGVRSGEWPSPGTLLQDIISLLHKKGVLDAGEVEHLSPRLCTAE